MKPSVLQCREGGFSVSSAAAASLAEAVVALELSHSVKATKCFLTVRVQAPFQPFGPQLMNTCGETHRNVNCSCSRKGR